MPYIAINGKDPVPVDAFRVSDNVFIKTFESMGRAASRLRLRNTKLSLIDKRKNGKHKRIFSKVMQQYVYFKKAS